MKKLIKKRRWSYHGHILRRPKLPMAIKFQNVLVVKSRERQRMNIATVTKNAMKEMDLTGLDEAKTKAQNRKEWKNQTFKKYMTRNYRKIRNN